MKDQTLLLLVAVGAAVICSVAASSALDRRSLDPSGDGIMIRGKYFRRNKTVSATKPTATQTYYPFQCVSHVKNCGNGPLWSQRYWYDFSAYKTGGPIFFMFGGEGNADGLINLYYNSYAATYNAVVVVLEHRFYGESFPTKNNPVTEEDFKLLTSEQALMDAVRFIHDFKVYNSMKDSKVVVFGGSYPGNLAAWAKEKYPGLINVAVASSAPVEAKFDFPQYSETVSRVIDEIDSDCFDSIKDSFACINDLVEGDTCDDSTVSKREDLPPALHDCASWDFDNKLEKEIFVYNLELFWESNYPGTENGPKCKTLDKENSTDSIKRYGQFRVDSDQAKSTCRSRSKRSNGEEKDEFMTFIKSEEGRDANSWTYQTCNEFGYFQTPDPTLNLFSGGWSTDIDVYRCQRAFPNSGFNATVIQNRVVETNKVYKGKQFDGTCTIFVNGMWDPWHLLSINSEEELAPAVAQKNSIVRIEKSEHCDDMQYTNKPNVRAAQENIRTLIGQYLQNPDC